MILLTFKNISLLTIQFWTHFPQTHIFTRTKLNLYWCDQFEIRGCLIGTVVLHFLLRAWRSLFSFTSYSIGNLTFWYAFVLTTMLNVKQRIYKWANFSLLSFNFSHIFKTFQMFQNFYKIVSMFRLNFFEIFIYIIF